MNKILAFNNYLIKRVFQFCLGDNQQLEQDDTKIYHPPLHYLKKNQSGCWKGSFIPPLTMASCALVSDKVYS